MLMSYLWTGVLAKIFFDVLQSLWQNEKPGTTKDLLITAHLFSYSELEVGFSLYIQVHHSGRRFKFLS